MTVRYDQDTDTLTIILGPDPYNHSAPFETGDFTVYLNEGDMITEITVANAGRFVTRALAAGVKVEGGPAIKPQSQGIVWHDADSSMISAFGYDESTGVLEVAFHRSGVYRYFDVPMDVFEGLLKADSKGSYMRGFIIDIYHYEQKRGRR
jgi:hypothetical protein